MTTKQILLSILMLGATGNIASMMEEFSTEPCAFKLGLTKGTAVRNMPRTLTLFDNTIFAVLTDGATPGIIITDTNFFDFLYAIDTKRSEQKQYFDILDIIFNRENDFVNCVNYPRFSFNDKIVDIIFIDTEDVNKCVQMLTNIQKSDVGYYLKSDPNLPNKQNAYWISASQKSNN